jgi:hypothetical protein
LDLRAKQQETMMMMKGRRQQQQLSNQHQNILENLTIYNCNWIQRQKTGCFPRNPLLIRKGSKYRILAEIVRQFFSAFPNAKSSNTQFANVYE